MFDFICLTVYKIIKNQDGILSYWNFIGIGAIIIELIRAIIKFRINLLYAWSIWIAPHITDEYYFEAHPGDGYAPSNSIFFKGATGAVSLRTYLETLGYTKEKRRLGNKEIWSKTE